MGERRPLRRAQVGAGHPHQYGSVSTDDVVVAGELVVLVVRPAAEPDFKDVAALLVAFAVDVAPAVDVVCLAARPVLPEPRRLLTAVSIEKCPSQDRGPRAVGLPGDGLHAVRLVGPVGTPWYKLGLRPPGLLERLHRRLRPGDRRLGVFGEELILI